MLTLRSLIEPVRKLVASFTFVGRIQIIVNPVSFSQSVRAMPVPITKPVPIAAASRQAAVAVAKSRLEVSTVKAAIAKAAFAVATAVQTAFADPQLVRGSVLTDVVAEAQAAIGQATVAVTTFEARVPWIRHRLWPGTPLRTSRDAASAVLAAQDAPGLAVDGCCDARGCALPASADTPSELAPLSGVRVRGTSQTDGAGDPARGPLPLPPPLMPPPLPWFVVYPPPPPLIASTSKAGRSPQRTARAQRTAAAPRSRSRTLLPHAPLPYAARLSRSTDRSRSPPPA